MDCRIRFAKPEDADAIAELHAASWRSAYRGMLSDAYLDGGVLEERRDLWRRRLQTEPGLDQGVLVAEEDGSLVGFICIFLEAEPGQGPLLDNLHVRPDRKGGGLGQRLIREGIAWMRTRGTFERWHLWVLEANLPTRLVYEHLGWEAVERVIHAGPDGTRIPVWRYRQLL